MPQVGEVRSAGGETRKWDGSRWQAVQAEAPAQEESSLMPSGESTIGGLLGLLSPAAAIPGAAIGSAVHQLRQSVPKLMAIGSGPMATDGVVDAMVTPALEMGKDIVKNTVLNYAPGFLGKLLSGTGRAATAAGNAARTANPYTIATRAAVGPILHSLGVGEAPAIAAEIAATAGPAVARKAGPLMERAGEAMPSTALSGLRSLGRAMKPGVPKEPMAPRGGVEWNPAGPSERATGQAAMEPYSNEWAPKAEAPPDSLAGLKKSVFQQMDEAGQFQGDRTTGQFEEGPGGLSSLAKLSSDKGVPSEAIMHDMEEVYGHGLRPTKAPFEFEGEASERPGEYPAGPAAPGFEVGPESTLPMDPLEQLMLTPSMRALKSLPRR